MGRRGGPRIIYHRGRGRRRMGALDWAKILGMGAVLLVVGGYIVRLFFFPAASAAGWSVWLPVVMR